MIEVQAGNTVRLKAIFKDFDGAPVDPSAITFTVSDSADPATEILRREITEADKTAVGEYFTLFTPPAPGRYQIEFSGLIGTAPALVRDWIRARP